MTVVEESSNNRRISPVLAYVGQDAILQPKGKGNLIAWQHSYMHIKLEHFDGIRRPTVALSIPKAGSQSVLDTTNIQGHCVG